MRPIFTVLLMFALVFGGGYFFYSASAVCKVPIGYRIGAIDPSFNITRDEVRAVVSDAESLWEDGTGRNLFTYDEGANLAINFVFDERQQATDAERDLREVLERKRGMSDSVREQYEALLDEYENLRETYLSRKAEYEADLEAHNAEVEHWNEEGGAPEDVFEDLQDRQRQLAEEQERLNRLTFELNQLVDRINEIGQTGNVLVEDYNRTVEDYNESFTEAREFTQGEYTRGSVSIYQYKDLEELRLVLAHEFGHALRLGHVEDPEAIMYHLMGKQDLSTGITEADAAEFDRVCGSSPLTLWSVL